VVRVQRYLLNTSLFLSLRFVFPFFPKSQPFSTPLSFSIIPTKPISFFSLSLSLSPPVHNGEPPARDGGEDHFAVGLDGVRGRPRQDDIFRRPGRGGSLPASGGRNPEVALVRFGVGESELGHSDRHGPLRRRVPEHPHLSHQPF